MKFWSALAEQSDDGALMSCPKRCLPMNRDRHRAPKLLSFELRFPFAYVSIQSLFCVCRQKKLLLQLAFERESRFERNFGACLDGPFDSSRATRCVPPVPSNTPSETSGKPILPALRRAKRISAAIATSNPPPTQ